MLHTIRNSGKKAIVFAIGIVLMLILLIVAALNMDIGDKHVADHCASSSHVRFIAYDARSGSHQFGPVQNYHDLDAAKQRFEKKLCLDPWFASTLASFETTGYRLDPTSVESQTADLAGNSKAWQTSVNQTLNRIKSYSIQNVNVSYETLAALPGAAHSDVPSLIKVDRPVKLGWALVLHMQDGSLRYLRIVCDLQPSAPRFPHVTVTPKPRPTPRHPSKPTPRPKHTKCPCISPTEVSQPVYDRNAPVPQYTHPPVAPGATAPTTRPKPLPSQAPGSEPSPNPNGYHNGGYGTAPGGGSPSPDSPQPTAHNTSDPGGF